MRHLGWAIGLLISALAAAGAAAQTDTQDPATRIVANDDVRRWSVHVDDDLFSFANHDRDYTGGVTFGLTGDLARHHPLSLAAPLERVDHATRFAAWRGDSTLEGEALEIGLLLFTPQNLAASQPLPDDRPYANLLYAASSEVALDAERGRAFQSSLAIGVLGLPVAEAMQQAIHKLFGNTEPRGYSHQISDGGEPTFMYSVSRYRLLAQGSCLSHPYSLRLGAGASVGYLTEANLELVARSDAPWWSSSAASADYAGHPVIGRPPAPTARRPRFQLEAGAKLHVRLYNAFLEGQFRHSDVAYSPHELEPVLVDLWVGVTTVFPRGFSVSYTIRHQTEEIQRGRGARSFAWGSIGIARTF
jgi:Outer membrane protein LpxR